MRFGASRESGAPWALAFSVALTAVGACASAVADGGAQAPGAAAPGQGWISGEASAAAPDAGADVRCPHGALEDPHRGFVRCLGPGEVDAGWLPPAPQPEPPPPADAGADGSSAPPGSDGGGAAQGADGGAASPGDAGGGAAPGVAPTPAPPGPPPLVELSEPAFVNGDVPNVVKRLEKASGEIAKCVGDNGGVSGASGSVKLQFLVRSRGRAEGVEILSARGVSPEAQRCIRLLLKNKPVGTPSADPVGVTVTLSLKPTK